MRFFTGQHERTIDAKNRIQLPAQLRAAIDPDRDGKLLYVTLGEVRGTLSLFTERGFEDLSERMETEYADDPESHRFELQFFALASPVEVDKQGRFVLPDRLRRKAKLPDEIFLVGRKVRVDIWNRVDLEEAMGIDWQGDEWPQWGSFMRKRPRRSE